MTLGECYSVWASDAQLQAHRSVCSFQTMSEPATKLERDIVFRKLRSKPENKVRQQSLRVRKTASSARGPILAGIDVASCPNRR